MTWRSSPGLESTGSRWDSNLLIDRDASRGETGLIKEQNGFENRGKFGFYRLVGLAIEAQSTCGDLRDAREFAFCFVQILFELSLRILCPDEVEQICNCFERVVDFVGNAGGEAAGHRELLGAAKRLLGTFVLQHLVANLILALASAQRDLERAEQSFGADGSFKKKNIPERPAHLAKPLAFGGDLATDSQQDEREV